jgi:hypothetical protein
MVAVVIVAASSHLGNGFLISTRTVKEEWVEEVQVM